MLNFYNFPEAVRVMFCMLTVINTGFAALVLILHQYRFNRGLAYWLNSVAAFFALCQTVINAALIAQVYQNISDGFIVASEYIIARYIVFAVLAVISVQCLVIRRRDLQKKAVGDQEKHIGNTPGKAVPLIPHSSFLIPHFTAAACSFLTLPFMETLTGHVFPVAFSVALVILLAGSIWLTVKIRRELITSISGLSVKQAMDSLDTAVLFYRENGHILMQNHKMQELMLKTAGRVFYNGRLYLETIRNEELGTGNEFIVRVTDTGIPNSSLLIPNSTESVWLFAVGEIKAGRKIVTRITAADVTGQNKAAVILNDKHNELKSRQERLKTFAENIEEICRSEELLRVKTEIHDVQNQKLIPLLQYLRYGELPDGTSFDALKAGILCGKQANMDIASDPQYMLDMIIGQHESIGIKIHINGNLPQKRDIALVLVQILQEAAANSVTHGYANEVYVRIMYNEGKYILRVTDNGTRFVPNFKEGSGIAGIRRYAGTLGGTLGISTDPRFTVTAEIPVGSEELGIRSDPLYSSDYISETEYISVKSDCEELRKILSSITKTIKMKGFE